MYINNKDDLLLALPLLILVLVITIYTLSVLHTYAQSNTTADDTENDTENDNALTYLNNTYGIKLKYPNTWDVYHFSGGDWNSVFRGDDSAVDGVIPIVKFEDFQQGESIIVSVIDLKQNNISSKYDLLYEKIQLLSSFLFTIAEFSLNIDSFGVTTTEHSFFRGSDACCRQLYSVSYSGYDTGADVQYDEIYVVPYGGDDSKVYVITIIFTERSLGHPSVSRSLSEDGQKLIESLEIA